ncbi:porin family protein [Lacinutrix sp. Bg11-31]|uniref:porin family protein n=1 Tax=Lacinutrix sp. Bg11-31 TaxID=2057808 RepID=UPI000C31A5DE|nr:porin family protein [Lacinutrix sp. Bg11-31]AUC81415.1 PorT family protein [Lacinutrix sp. Bg11-31]
MKKLLLITAISIFGLTKAQAQDVEFGAKIGANFSSIYGDTTDDIEMITSVINFGVYSEISLTEKFSFQPEIMYSIQGFSVVDNVLSTDNIVSLNYINVPLMGKYYVTKGLSLEAGPQIGFLLSAKNENIDVKDSFKSIDYGVNLGLGYKLENGLNFGARYNFGLSNINDVNGSTDKFRNGVAQLTIGYSFF